MSAGSDGRAGVLTTAEVGAGEEFAYWRELICATFLRLEAEPVGAGGFSGRIEHVPAGELELSSVASGGQRVRRTPSLIAQGDGEYLLANIQRRGSGRVEQDGRDAVLSAGDIAFYDGTRPYALHFDGPFHQLVVRIPLRDLAVRDTRRLTARAFGGGTPGGVVAAFFVALFDLAKTSPEQSALMAPHAAGLLSAAASFANRTAPEAGPAHALVRERVLDFLRRNLADPRLDAAAVADGCHVSRRTLYRVLGEEGVAERLRRMRIERAKMLLRDAPERPVGAVGAACGFGSESGFHRAFRAATGRTPSEYRRTWHAA